MQRVILITIDTLRADQPWTGYARFATPALSSFADRSLVYTRAWSVANTTGPSLAGLLASRYPSELERDDCPLAGFTLEDGLADVLSRNRVWTAAAHGHPYFASEAAPKRGFQAWRTVKNVLGRRASAGAVTGPDVTDIATQLLDSAPKDRPAFIWVHYVDPHHTYVAHPDFPPSDHPARGPYDGEVAFTDHQVGRLLARIGASEEGARTAIILTADHGEAFGEHGVWRHGTSVYDEEVRIPLLIYVPGLEHSRTDLAVSAIDIAPTIAGLLSISAPSNWRGRSLVPPGPSTAHAVIVDAPALINAPERRAVVLDGRYKVVQSNGTVAVFDLQTDPAERQPLHGDSARGWIGAAVREWSSLHTVPSSACRRQAFIPSP